MAEPIYFIGGSKGGVGKSMVAMALLDYLMVNGKVPLLVEADTSNPDVWKAYGDEVESTDLDLDHVNGWMDLINYLDANKEKSIVVNTPARNNAGVEKYGQALVGVLKELQRPLEVFWVINRQRDSVELLGDFLGAMAGTRVHVVRNLHHGHETQFELYNSSVVKTEIETKWKGKSLNFPDLADRVADQLNKDRLTIAEGTVRFPLGNRAELQRWRREVSSVLGEVVNAQRAGCPRSGCTEPGRRAAWKRAARRAGIRD